MNRRVDGDSASGLSGSRRYAVFAFLDPSVSQAAIERAVDKKFLLSKLNEVTESVVQRAAKSEEGLDLTRNLLMEFYHGKRFPGRASILGMLGTKAAEHTEAAEYCLVFQDYRSMLVLLRAASQAAAMMRYLSQNDGELEEWARLTAHPTRLKRKKIEKMENRAMKHQNANIRRMFNCIVHPNLSGLMATEEFGEEDVNSPSTETEERLTGIVVGSLKREPVASPRVNSEPQVERLRVWRVYAAFLLAHVIELYQTVRGVTGDSKNDEQQVRGKTWQAETKRLL